MSTSFEIQNRIGILTLNRPESLNALNSQVLGEIAAHVEQIKQKSFLDLRALIITGAGEKAFVAGADIKEISSLNASGAKQFSARGQQIFSELENLKIPVIAAVNGFALGGGLELALACDVILASENAKFGLPEVSLGLIPGFGGTVRLARVVGLNLARDLIFTGRMLSATEAREVNLVSKVTPAGEVLKVALTFAEQMTSRSPLAIDAAKKSVLEGFDQERARAMATECAHFEKLFQCADVREGTDAFIAKRKPNF